MSKTHNRRRLFQFSLKTFLLVATFIGIAIGWYFSRAEQQKRSIASLKVNAKYVSIKYQYYNHPESSGFSPTMAELPTPVWATMLGLEDHFIIATKLSCYDLADLSNLSGLNGLRELRLSNSPQTDLSPLANLKNLNKLVLDRCTATDLSPLYGLSNLNGLIVLYTNITEEELTKLKQEMPTVTVTLR